MSVIEIHEPPTIPEAIHLADGRRLSLHEIGPGSEALVVTFLEGLGPDARYRRFHQPLPRVTDSLVRQLCAVDQHRHLAWLLLDGTTPVAEVRAVASRNEPSAEVAVAVADSHRRAGVARRALLAIGVRAAELGARSLTAVVQPDNLASLSLMRSLGMDLRLEDGVVECRGPVPTAAPGVSPAPQMPIR